MSELDIALKKVYPTLISDYEFKKECIEGYGRVPIQVGQLVVWADYVCYYYKANKKIPFCVIEIKECDDNSIDFAIPQAESYAQRINAPFFCCTNGSIYNWFMTGTAQGDSLRLETRPALPNSTYLVKPMKIDISPYLYEAIRNFEMNVKTKGTIYEDCVWHNDSTNALYQVLWDREKLKNKN